MPGLHIPRRSREKPALAKAGERHPDKGGVGIKELPTGKSCPSRQVDRLKRSDTNQRGPLP